MISLEDSKSSLSSYRIFKEDSPLADNANTSNNTAADKLSLTTKPALVQNSEGIFYGFLEKSDTRNGTALLRDAFKLSPDRHITFVQYLDFLSNEISDRYWSIEAAMFAKNNPDMSPMDYIEEIGAVPDEITITSNAFNEHKRNLSITDYASEGIFLVQRRTSSHENSRHIQTSAPLVSLSGVVAIVNISEKNTFHPGVQAVKQDLKDNGVKINDDVSLSEMHDIAEFYEYITPLITFGFISNDHKAVSTLLGAKIDKIAAKQLVTVIESLAADKVHRVTESIGYLVDTLLEQFLRYYADRWGLDSLKGIKDFQDIGEDLWNFYNAIDELPALVVNSVQRSDLYAKKAQLDEQDK